MNEGIRLLVVDDRPQERMALRKQLILGGLNIGAVAESGLGGEAVAAAEELQPDIILLGLEEPLARPLRVIETMTLVSRAPVIVLSSIGDRECLRKAMRAGAKEYLIKPVRPEELAKAINEVFRAEQQRRSLINTGRVTMASQGEIVTIFASKGGVGKTTLASNLAVALSLETKRRVVLFDLNLEQPDVPIMLDIVPEHTMSDVVRILDRLEVDGDLIQRFLLPHSSGVEVLAAAGEPNTPDMVNEEHVRRIIQLLAKHFDYVIVDTPPRFYSLASVALELSNMVLLVTTPEIPCLKNTRAVLQLLRSQRSFADKIKLVVNNAYPPDGISQGEVGKILDYPIFWKMPHDRDVAECIRLGKPCVQERPSAQVARNITSLARTLTGTAKPQGGLGAKLWPMGRK